MAEKEAQIIELDEDELLSDDLMPNAAGSEPFQVVQDEDMVQEISEEKAAVSTAGPLVDLLLDWFDNEIEAAADIANLKPESKVPMESQVIAMQVLKAVLLDKKTSLQSMRDEYLK